jgi:hypothetical protein
MVPPLFMKGCYIISSKVGLFKGSKFNILTIRAFASSEIGTLSGKE